MKHYYLLIGLTFSVSISIAQTNTFPPNCNVVIGIPFPTQILQVHLLTDSKPAGVIAPSLPVLKLSRYGTPLYSYDEGAEFRIGHGGPSYWGSKLDLYLNGTSNQNGNPDELVMTWLYNGSVGIGTQNPVSKLTVGGGDIKAFNHDGNSGISIGAEATERPRVGFHASDDSRRFKIEMNSINTNDERLGFFSTKGGSVPDLEILSINKVGNIGIGTTTPDSKLAVNGIIHSKEVKVDQTNWPDYVFTKDYRLPSLKEIENNIKEEGRLSGIPSAEDVKTNGVELGDMNAKLLQKIEELTLHVIELGKQGEKQQEQLLKQQLEIENLNKKYQKN